MKKILVTGAAGFIGSHLTDRLLKEKYKVVGIDNLNNLYNPKLKKQNLTQALTNKNFIFKKVDILNESFLSDIFKTFRPDYVVHLAAYAGVRPSLEQPVLYTQVNVNGTINILEQIKKYKVKNFIFASSSSVYGNNKKVPFSETDNVENQVSPYALTKKSGELLCRTYAELYKIPTTALRFFTVYGPRQRPDLAIRKFMTKIINNEAIEMYGKGDTARDYTYIDDIIDGIMRALNKPHKFEIINLGNSHPVKLKQLISLVEGALNQKARVKTLPMQMGDVEKTYADISNAWRKLKWKPKTDIKAGLKIMAEWLQTNNT